MAKYVIENIVVVLDRSGSMERIKEATVDGFNEFIQEQDMDGTDDTAVTLYQFNHEIDKVYENKPVEDAGELTDETFEPVGRTAYYDALAQAVTDAPDEDTLFFVVTDGIENASTDTDQEDVKKLVEEAKNEGHEFMLMDGSGRNEELAAEEIGVNQDRTISYDSNKSGTTRAAYMSSSNVSQQVRKGDDNAGYDQEDRDQAKT